VYHYHLFLNQKNHKHNLWKQKLEKIKSNKEWEKDYKIDSDQDSWHLCLLLLFCSRIKLCFRLWDRYRRSARWTLSNRNRRIRRICCCWTRMVIRSSQRLRDLLILMIGIKVLILICIRRRVSSMGRREKEERL